MSNDNARPTSEFSDQKSDSYKDSNIVLNQPHAIIKRRLNEIAKKYYKEKVAKLYKLIDYLSEWTKVYKINEKTSIDLMLTAITQRLYEEHNENQRLPSLEIQVPFIFDSYTSTPESFLEYLVGGEKLKKIQDQIKKRTPQQNKEIINLIEQEWGRKENFILKKEKIVENFIKRKKRLE